MTAEFYHAYLREANQKRQEEYNPLFVIVELYIGIFVPLFVIFSCFYILSFRRKLLCVMNPNKFRSCEFLIRQHEERNDKVLVFWYVYILFTIGFWEISPIYRFVFIVIYFCCSDDVFPLLDFAHRLNKPVIYGQTPNDERQSSLHRFQNDSNFNTLFISQVSITISNAKICIRCIPY